MTCVLQSEVFWQTETVAFVGSFHVSEFEKTNKYNVAENGFFRLQVSPETHLYYWVH
jgi:hypothetical protein